MTAVPAIGKLQPAFSVPSCRLYEIILELPVLDEYGFGHYGDTRGILRRQP